MPILTTPEIEKLEQDVQAQNKKICEMKASLQKIEMKNYTFIKSDGSQATLLNLFQGHPYLVLRL